MHVLRLTAVIKIIVNYFKEKFLAGLVLYFSKAVSHSCSAKRVLLEILKNTQENTCASFSF